MTRGLIGGREVVVWILGFVIVAALLVITGFESDDPDSALYAALSARLAEGPPAHWIAPEWWGHWDSEGLFREHPAGVFLLPAALGALGVPGAQAAYIVGIAAGLASVLLLAHLVGRATTVGQGRLSLILLQVMPLAFIFRIRANHEYPMLACLLAALVGFDRVRTSWRWLPVPALALTAALLVKGVFVAIPLLAAGLWVLINPLRTPGPLGRPLAAGAIAVAVMTAAAFQYDTLYLRVTGESFWAGYWARQLAPLTIATPVEGGATFVHHLGFYALRLLWHPAPWSVALLAAAWRARGRVRHRWRALQEPVRRGIAFTVLFAAMSILLLSLPSRFAERYAFSANYVLAAAGIAAAADLWPRLTTTVRRIDERVPALAALCWTGLMLLRLAVGPLLPRISS
jgi:4-amino-4-deoxy-L-arabinose transferase-like glycosyltransferase